MFTTTNIVLELLKISFVPAIIFTYAVVIDAILSNGEKRIVFWNKEMPGAYVFTKI